MANSFLDFFIDALLEDKPYDGPPRTAEELRSPCAPDEVTRLHAGSHVHRCECSTAWKHGDDLTHASTKEEFKIAHTCPACGSDVRDKYFGPEGLRGEGA